jgi:hypothetical protein
MRASRRQIVRRPDMCDGKAAFAPVSFPFVIAGLDRTTHPAAIWIPGPDPGVMTTSKKVR